MTGIGVLPQVVSAEMVGARLLVQFSEPMAPTGAILVVGNYTITEDVGSDPLTVTGAVVSGDDAVLLTLSAQPTPGDENYNVEVDAAVTDLAGNGIDPAADDADFDGRTAEPVVADWCALGTSRLLAQFADQPRMRALLCLLLDRVQDVEQVAADMRDLRSLETATGAQLDEWGLRLGFPRDPGSMTDGDYRRYLVATAAARIAECSPDDMIEVALAAAGLNPGDITHLEDYPARVLQFAESPLSYETGHLTAVIARIAKPAGVGYGFQYEPDVPELVLTFDDDAIRPLRGFDDDVVVGPGVMAERDSGVP